MTRLCTKNAGVMSLVNSTVSGNTAQYTFDGVW